MQVIKARVAGFCPGVRRAIQMAEAAVASAAGCQVWLLGKIVHNDSVINQLESLGIRTLPENGMPPAGSIVVIRSHGVPPARLNRLQAAGCTIVDATCRKVAANQRAAASLAAAGHQVVIAGDEGHGEVIGLVGHAPGAIVISNAQCARALHLDRNVALVAQTTISQSELDAIRDALAARTTVIDAGGVCGATTERQSALLAVLPQVDAVVVVGGKDSANTRRLAALASQAGKPVWLVGTATDVPDDVGRFAKVGLSAGASTPDSDIDAVERRLLELGQA